LPTTDLELEKNLNLVAAAEDLELEIKRSQLSSSSSRKRGPGAYWKIVAMMRVKTGTSICMAAAKVALVRMRPVYKRIWFKYILHPPTSWVLN
jgi:hypothetical protein